MKKFTFIISLIAVVVSLQAQDYYISFAGTGASSHVEEITVENITQGKSMSLNGTDVLHLVATSTDVNPLLDHVGETLHVYPNPMSDKSTIVFVATTAGKTSIELFDNMGNRVASVQSILTPGRHSYQVSGLCSGLYTVRIQSQAYTYSGKIISNSIHGFEVKIGYLGNSINPTSEKMLKSASGENTMQYTTGDRLKFMGKSGNSSTVIMDVPTKNKVITFNFVACTDADGNNYPIVQIGTQLWMAENLKTTKYNDGTDIPNVNDNAEWISLTTGAYCWYKNDNTYKNPYGALYNWHAVNTGKLAPLGWHVMSESDWITLTDYLTNNGYGDANNGLNIAKSIAANWSWNPFVTIGTVGRDLNKNNSTGFTALPGGARFSNTGNFYDLYNNGYWWTSKSVDADRALSLYLRNYDANVVKINTNKGMGFSVRCIMD